MKAELRKDVDVGPEAERCSSSWVTAMTVLTRERGSDFGNGDHRAHNDHVEDSKVVRTIFGLGYHDAEMCQDGTQRQTDDELEDASECRREATRARFQSIEPGRPYKQQYVVRDALSYTD